MNFKPISQFKRNSQTKKFVALVSSGKTLHAQGELVKAQNYYLSALKIEANSDEIIYLLGVSHLQLGNYVQAAELLNKAVEINCKNSEYLYHLGLALHQLDQKESALISYELAIQLNPDMVIAHSNKGAILRSLKDFHSSRLCYEEAIRLDPFDSINYSNLGAVLLELNQFADAKSSCIKAISLNINNADAHLNLGNALLSLNSLHEAVVSYKDAIAINDKLTLAYVNLGAALLRLKRASEASLVFKKACDLDSTHPYLQSTHQFSKMQYCNWIDFENTLQHLQQRIAIDSNVCLPFHALSLLDEPALHLKVAEDFSELTFPKNFELGDYFETFSNKRIHLAYFSADFNDHPVAHLVLELFKNHDKEKFLVSSFSLSAKQDEISKEVQKFVDNYYDVNTLSDIEIAQLARKLNVDIAIDLTGYTENGRPRIFSYGVAPIQTSYIGYLGSMGSENYDYLFGDETLVPIDHQKFYSEKIAYLPSYQVNGLDRCDTITHFSRADLNIPESSFVFCCFNNCYKIHPTTFTSWMNILKAVPNSVLFLYIDSQETIENLQREALARDISSDRLIFGKRVNRADYFARFHCCDLFLDTFTYNAGTTAADALWGGLPILTKIGLTFPSRLAASLLHSLEIPELITQSSEEYERIAIELARDPAKLQAIKKKVLTHKLNARLFDTNFFTRSIEAVYFKMAERYVLKLSTDHIYVNDYLADITPST